jgi:hypothetical protein
MRPLDASTPRTPEEQLRQLAAVLAAGLRRRPRCSPLPANPVQNPEPENSPESVAAGLELSAEMRLSAHTG